MASRKCRACGEIIPAARVRAIPSADTCVRHSDAEKIEGLMEFGHKTAPELVILPKDSEKKRMARRNARRAR